MSLHPEIWLVAVDGSYWVENSLAANRNDCDDGDDIFILKLSLKLKTFELYKTRIIAFKIRLLGYAKPAPIKIIIEERIYLLNAY